MISKKLLPDMEHIMLHTKDVWQNLSNKTVFITGGTGFFGKWLLESFIYANQKLSLRAKAIVLSRNPEQFLKELPQFNRDDLDFIKGDIRDFKFPDEGIDYIIHAATEASASLNIDQPLLMYDTIVAGTRKVLELAKAKGVLAMLHTSSGAVYGLQPSATMHITEEYKGAPDILAKDAAYGEAKRVAEMLAAFYYRQYGVSSKIARCFAFVGPYLPLDTHFAIGNFINSVLHNKDIEIKGDGTPHRSYLYASDLVIWLWQILFNGAVMEPYNVGSDENHSIEGIAWKVASFGQSTKVQIALPKSSNPPSRYVPSISKVQKLLGLQVRVPLNAAIQKTIAFYKSSHN